MYANTGVNYSSEKLRTKQKTLRLSLYPEASVPSDLKSFSATLLPENDISSKPYVTLLSTLRTYSLQRKG
jgi:hypothetical protein